MSINNVSPQTSIANIWTAIQTFLSNLVSPAVVGGTTSTSSLTLQPTSGAGTTGADIIFKVGNNGATEAARMLNNGNVGIGTSGPVTKLHVAGGTSGLLEISLDNTAAGGHRYSWQADVSGQMEFVDRTSGLNRLTISTGGGIALGSYAGGSVPADGLVISGNVGIGTSPPLTTLHVNGGLAVGVVTKTAAYTATLSDYVILADATAGAFTVTLPAATQKGQIITVIKIDSSVNAITVSRAGADTIEGATTKTLSTQYAKTQLVGDGVSKWYDLVAGLI